MLDLESLFNLSYGMCIVSSGSSDKFSGCIVNTAAQITPEPPMLTISLNTKSLTNGYIIESGVFAVSVLTESTPLEFIGRFGFRTSRNFDKFEGVNYKIGSLGVPIITDNTIGFIEVEVVNKIDIETHTLFIGRIIACEKIDSEKMPMTYSYYRDIKGGKTPKSAATYVKKKINNKSIEGANTMKKYKCIMCSYIYDPAVGDTIGGIEPGTAFEDLPESWACPECGASKDDFEPVE